MSVSREAARCPFPSELGCEFRVCLFHSKFLNCVFMLWVFFCVFSVSQYKKGPVIVALEGSKHHGTHKPELYPAKQDLLSYLLLAVQI